MTFEELLADGDLTALEESTRRYMSDTVPCGKETDERAYRALSVAEAYYSAGEEDEAFTWTHQALVEGPRADAFCMLGKIAASQGDMPVAARWYDLACNMAPPPKRGLVELARDRHAIARATRGDLTVRPVRHVDVVPGASMLAVMASVEREGLLRRTLASLAAAGASTWPGSRVVFFDGLPLAGIDPWWEVVSLPKRGQAQTFFSVLRAASNRSCALTMFEGDVVLPRNALPYIATAVLDPDIVLASWFHRLGPRVPTVDPHWHVEHASMFSCNQGITVSRAAIRRLLDSSALRDWSEPHGADMIFSRVMPQARVAHHFPNFVQHTGGAESLVGNVEPRTSPTFVGEDFDALMLIP